MQLMIQDPEDEADDLAGYCSKAYETLSLSLFVHGSKDFISFCRESGLTLEHNRSIMAWRK